MNFQLNKSIEILKQTPYTLDSMLGHLSDEWIMNNEGGDSWSPYTIIGHLIHGEKTDWIPRMELILSDLPNKHFVPFDRMAQIETSKDKSIDQLLIEFKTLRALNIQVLQSKNLSAYQLNLKGIHPVFGEVTIAQLLSTWAVHDLNHIAQISRVMATQYKSEVGPWIQYLKILNN